MVATKYSDNKLRTYYRNLGYEDRKNGNMSRVLDGLVLAWYTEGLNSPIDYWNIKPMCLVFKESESELAQYHSQNGRGVGIIMGM